MFQTQTGGAIKGGYMEIKLSIKKTSEKIWRILDQLQSTQYTYMSSISFQRHVKTQASYHFQSHYHSKATKNWIWRNMRVNILAKTEFSSKQRKKWMSGIQMNVEDAKENGMDFHYWFCGLIFFIRSQDLHYCFCDKCISLSAPGRELDKDLQMSCLSMHHLGELPL